MIGHQHDKRWITEKVGRLPFRFRGPLERRYQRTYDIKGRQAANLLLLDIEEATAGASWRLAASDDELCSWAERRAASARRMAIDVNNQEVAYLCLSEFCCRSEVEPEEVNERRTVAGAVARMCCQMWWRRRVRRGIGRRVEAAAITLGLVNNRAGIYASDETKERRGQQRARNRAMLESCLAVNELGQSYTLAELAALSVSNPVIRRSELMVRMCGFEQYAEGAGHVGDFYTWTCPSRMHYSSDRYDGTTPRQAAQYLGLQWARARAAMKRDGVHVYGFRVAEPHHDGCPHWHMLFFMAPEHREQVRDILKRYALQVDGNEPGAALHRFKVVEIDKRKGTAAGYLAKYVAKNIDAFGLDSVDEDLTGKRDPQECAKRVDAWASCWGIRQFQAVGGPKVTVWREARRLRDQVQPCEVIDRVRSKANVGDWCGFMQCQEVEPVELAKVWSDKPGRYGEEVGGKVIGIKCGPVVVVTRVHEWRIERGKDEIFKDGVRASDGTNILRHGFGRDDGEVCGDADRVNGRRRSTCVGDLFRGPAFAHERKKGVSLEPWRHPPVCPLNGLTHEEVFDFRGAAAAPWSPVNNCTGVVDGGKLIFRENENLGRKASGFYQ